jgi:quinol monooxygenase YgiN
LIIVTARMQCRAGQDTEFIAAAQDAVVATRAEPGCISYAFLQDQTDPSVYMFVEEWSDGAALREHAGTEHLRAFQEAARRHVAEQEVRLHTVEKSRTL